MTISGRHAAHVKDIFRKGLTVVMIVFRLVLILVRSSWTHVIN